MPSTSFKRPTIDELKDALARTGGHLTNTAAALGLNRSTLWRMAKEDEQADEAITASRKKMLDDALMTANIIALGIPIKDASGRITGWEVPPDSGMLRYLISTLGRDEGFSEKLDLTSNGKDIGPIQIEVITSRDQVRKE